MLGLGAKMFIIAGPVIVYGTLASVIYGIIYYVFSLFRCERRTDLPDLGRLIEF